MMMMMMMMPPKVNEPALLIVDYCLVINCHLFRTETSPGLEFLPQTRSILRNEMMCLPNSPLAVRILATL